jgi:hypothetical protein
MRSKKIKDRDGAAVVTTVTTNLTIDCYTPWLKRCQIKILHDAV